MKNNPHNPAYKQTPIGLIPKDWEVKKLGELGKIVSGGTPSTNIEEYWNGDIYWVTPTDITALNGSKYLKNTTRTITKSGLKNSSAEIIPINSIVVTTRATIGECAINKIPVSTNQGFKSIIPNDKIDFEYLFYLLIQRKNELKTFGNGSTFFEVSKTDFSNFQVPISINLAEQRKIATILSTWDTAIEKTTRIIENLKKRNNGLTQQLLSGKKRLKGFDAKWYYYKLNEIFERITRRNTELNTNVVTISAQRGFIKQTDFFTKTVASDILDNYFLVEKGEFCYNKSYSNGYPWGATKRLNNFDKAVVTTLYICFGFKEKALNSSDFFEHYFESGILDTGLSKIAHEGGRAHGLLNVTPTDFFNLKIQIPSLSEQKAITEVLTGASTELKLYETRLEKLKLQKKGLMQKLLTGEVRVKIDNYEN